MCLYLRLFIVYIPCSTTQSVAVSTKWRDMCVSVPWLPVCVCLYAGVCVCVCPVCYIYLNCCSLVFLLHFDKFAFPGSLWGQCSICCYLGPWCSREHWRAHTQTLMHAHTHNTHIRDAGPALYGLLRSWEPIRHKGVFKVPKVTLKKSPWLDVQVRCDVMCAKPLENNLSIMAFKIIDVSNAYCM